MITDLTTLLSNAQAITATANSTNILDLGAPGTIPGPNGTALQRDPGKGEPIPLLVTVVQSFNNLTSLTISIQVATDTAFTSPVTVDVSPAYALADLAVGARYLLPDTIPVGSNLRYLRLVYTVAGTAPTLGQITAGVVMGRQTNFA